MKDDTILHLPPSPDAKRDASKNPSVHETPITSPAFRMDAKRSANQEFAKLRKGIPKENTPTNKLNMNGFAKILITI